MKVPPSLRLWFVVHFVADIAFAIPLFFAPEAFLSLLGWQTIDPVTTRIVAAALVGIGVQSLLARHESAEVFRAMLSLKVLWSATATLGILWSVLDGGPPFAWAFVGIFALFNVVWTRYYLMLRREG
ncbi:MAG: hypothetical protein H6710_17040 [Myxococcales bacterium]|nr:hypothetical protein [Myxococcales bacterium]MCB9704903.1 hypothetical protein [Myxococcales bacterium]